MIYRFKFVSDEVSNFSRVIDIDAGATFADLRKAILESVGYSAENLDSFFICDEEWNPGLEIALEDMGFSSSDEDVYLMDDTVIEDMIDEEGQKLIFMYDNLGQRAFFMELRSATPGKRLDSPTCVRSEGEAPKQIASFDEVEEKTEAALAKNKARQEEEDFGTDLYGDDDYDIEDIAGLDDFDFH